MQDSAEWNVTEIRRCAVLADHAVGEHRERMRRVAEELARRFHAEAAATIRMIDERQDATVRARLFQGGKLPGFGPIDFGSWFFVLGSWFLAGDRRGNDETGED